MLKRISIQKDQREFLSAKIEKISIVIKNINGSEDPLMHKAEGPSYFFLTLSHIIKLSR